MRRRLAAVLCLLVPALVLPGAALAAETSSAPTIDAATGLIVAPGWEQVRIHCGGCHSHRLVTGQRGDRESWLAIIRWMQATQNLWQFEPAVETALLDYLATNYAPRPDRRRAPLPPWLMPPGSDAGAFLDKSPD